MSIYNVRKKTDEFKHTYESNENMSLYPTSMRTIYF
jgi:hypothetical protein